jgi:hypothetical protein
MLGIIATIPIVLWFLGFFAFHVNTVFIDVVIFISIILLMLYIMRQIRVSAQED